MYEYMITAIVLYLSVTWLLRLLRIQRKYGDLYVVVTGCDSGFGRALTYKLDEHGFNVFAACLTQEAATEIDRTTSERIRTAIVDITKVDTISKLYETVNSSLSNENALWGIVNNAGVAIPYGPCSAISKTECLAMFDVNLFGMMEVTRQFVPLLRKSRGRIVNTSSALGRFSMCFGSYTMSKFGVEAYSDCLRRELYNQGVSVHIIEPGGFATPISTALTKTYIKDCFERVLKSQSKEIREYYGPDFPKKIGEKYEDLMTMGGSSKDTYKVVDAYFHALTARFPRVRYVVGQDANTVFRFLWMCPEWLSDFIVANVSIESVKPAGFESTQTRF